MAARFPDIEMKLISSEEVDEDAVSDKGSSRTKSSTKQHNKIVTTSKDILRRCGFTDEEVDLIGRKNGSRLQETAETASKLHKQGFPKSHIFQLILTDLPSSQKEVQDMITRSEGVSKKSSKKSGRTRGSTLRHVGSSSSSKGIEAEPPGQDEDAELLKNLPQDLKEGLFHVFLLFCDEDHREALSFVHFLEDVLKLKVCVVYENRNLGHIGNVFERHEAAIRRSLFTFIFVTQRMCDDKTWAKFHGMTALADAIESNAEFVVPVRAENCSIPFHLQPLTALRIYHVVKDLVDHPDIQHSYNSSRTTPTGSKKQLPFVERQVMRLVNSRVDVWKVKEKSHQKKIEDWIEEEQLRRLQEQLDREREEVLRKAKSKMMKKQMEEQARENLERELRELAKQSRQKIPSQDPGRPSPSRESRGSPPGNTTPARARREALPGCDPLGQNQQGIHITNYVFPNVANPADLAPKPTFNVQANQIGNLQLGDKNQILETTGVEVAPRPASAALQVESPEVISQQPAGGMSYAVMDARPDTDDRGSENNSASGSLDREYSSLAETGDSCAADPGIPFSVHDSGTKTYEPASGTFAQTVRKEAIETGSLELSSLARSHSERDPFVETDIHQRNVGLPQVDPFASDTSSSRRSSTSESSGFEMVSRVSDDFSRLNDDQTPLQEVQSQASAPDDQAPPPDLQLQEVQSQASAPDDQAPPPDLQSLSLHNFESAEAHLRHSPGRRDPFEDDVPEQPLDLLPGPAGEFDAFSIRSMPRGHGATALNAQFQTGGGASDVTMNGAMAHPLAQ